MNDVKITLGNGGLGRDTKNTDIISGFVFYTNLKEQADFDNAAITGFDEDNRMKHFYSLEQFELETGITFNNSATEEIWYQLAEYDRASKEGFDLYIGLFYDTNNEPTPVNVDYSEIKDLQVYANGTIKQFAVYQAPVGFLASNVEAIQTICDNMFNEHMPANVVYGADTSHIDVTALPDLKSLATPSKDVSVIIAQDGDKYGNSLFNSLGYSIPAVGLALGTVSTAKVNESIAWVQKFNIAGNGELDNPAFGDGTLVKNTLLNTLDALGDKGYIFARKYVGDSGTYFNDNYTCDAASSDYAYMSEVRTIYKASRNARTVLLPYLNSPVKIDSSTGQLDKLTVANWTNVLNNELKKMYQANEISAYKVYIDPAQNVLLTSTIYVKITLVPYGTARNIDVTIGYSAKI